MTSPPLAPTRSRHQKSHPQSNAIWTQEEDELLKSQVIGLSPIPWSSIAKNFPNKTAPQLAGRWEKVLDPKLLKGSWTREEDETLLKYVEKYGDKDWAKLAVILDGRTGKQCRERFKNHLDPKVNHTSWTEEDDNKLIELHSKYGNCWTKLATFFEGRTDNCVKNRWNSTLKRRLERIQNHEPLVMKRGRKPKVRQEAIPKPEVFNGSVAHNQASSVCSSPVVASKISAISLSDVSPFIEIIPYMCSHESKDSRKSVSSLEESRNHLHQLLSSLE